LLDDGDDLVAVQLLHHLALFRLTDPEGSATGGVMGGI
jgi:hypothetical protein